MPSAVAPMNPPTTATSPRSVTGTMACCARAQVAAMSGTAQVYSASVTITCRASTQAAGTPASASAAATIRLLASSPVAATASSSRGETSCSAASARTMSASAVNSARTSRTTAARRAPLATPAATATWRSTRSFSRIVAPSRSPCSTSRATSSRPSVTFDSAETTTTGGLLSALVPAACFSICRRTIAASRAIASASATEVPPNFITTRSSASF